MAGSSRRHLPDTLLFMKDVWALGHSLEVASRRMHRELGVTGPQRLVIRIVGRAPGISPRELSDTLEIDPSTLSGVLARLVAGGFLVRRADPDDRRRLRCFLTPAGRRIDRTRRGTVEAAVRRALARIGRTRSAQAAELFRLLVHELGSV